MAERNRHENITPGALFDRFLDRVRQRIETPLHFVALHFFASTTPIGELSDPIRDREKLRFGFGQGEELAVRDLLLLLGFLEPEFFDAVLLVSSLKFRLAQDRFGLRIRFTLPRAEFFRARSTRISTTTRAK